MVPGRAPGRRLALPRLLRVERHGRAVPRRPRHLRGLRAFELDAGIRWRRRTTGIASSTTSPTSTSTIPPFAGDMLDAMEFWLDRGLDGFRCDAVPYLFEREGTNCENLPETHDFLREVCARTSMPATTHASCLPRRTSGPPTCVAYFGDGDECHMAFHFPLMPRLFMALRHSDRRPDHGHPRSRRPTIPRTCQWCLFLRNHDELTLEMVTDEERVDMYHAYARDPQDAAQPRHPAPPGPAARQRPPQDRAPDQPPLHAARQPRSSTTATRSAWATTSTSATATVCAPRCNGREIATRASPGRTPPACTCP